jgi:endonuclease YncB( thermonuclease family)
MRAVLAFLLCLVLVASAYAATHRVVAVPDGSTMTVVPLQGGDRVKIRLHGIAAPALRQPYGEMARSFVHNAVLFKEVDVRPMPQGPDRDGRIAAVVDIPGVGILQALMLSVGFAWVYPQTCRDCSAWEAMQAQARMHRKGLWAGKNPVPPWEWKR